MSGQPGLLFEGWVEATARSLLVERLWNLGMPYKRRFAMFSMIELIGKAFLGQTTVQARAEVPIAARFVRKHSASIALFPERNKRDDTTAAA